jgi:hypothetical protein
MRLLFGAAVVTASLILAATVFAQSTPDSPKADSPKADSPKADSTKPDSAAAAPVAANPGAAVPLPMGKRLACQTASQAMNGQDRRDQMQLCMEQARLDCLKQAIDQKIVGPQRRDFVRNCEQ